MPPVEDMLPQAQISRLAELYRLNLEVLSSAGTFGVREGRETGASVEIQDFREYVPGDDLRRIDWFSSARTDRLIVRLYREEVSPFFDLVVDTSASMSIRDGRKAALAHELCRWMWRSAGVGGLAVRLFAAGSELRRLDQPEELEFTQAESVLFAAPARAVAGFRRASVRVVLSDFMSAVAPASVVKALSAGAARLVTVHLLGPWEANPQPTGPCMLDAVEERRRADITLDRRTVEDYRRRLGALRTELREQTFRYGGVHVEVVADRDLEGALRSAFLPVGLVEVL